MGFVIPVTESRKCPGHSINVWRHDSEETSAQLSAAAIELHFQSQGLKISKMRLETSNKDSNKMNDDMQASLSEDDSSLVSMDDFSDSSGSGKHSSVAEVKKTPDIADAETRAVRVSKILMIIGLITTAVAVSVVIYLNSHDQEDDDFHNAVCRSYIAPLSH